MGLSSMDLLQQLMGLLLQIVLDHELSWHQTYGLTHLIVLLNNSCGMQYRGQNTTAVLPPSARECLSNDLEIPSSFIPFYNYL